MRILPAACAAVALCCAAACASPASAPSASDGAAVLPSAPATELACTGTVDTGPLPAWARDGFSPADQAVPHVVGAGGDIVGVLFGLTLHSPPAPERANKILWVARPSATADSGDSLGTELAIRARLNGVGTTATATVSGGPGPSVLDLPAAGCWTVTLTWSGRTDTVALRYSA